MKIDLVMWSFDGSRTLDAVLKRINQVIPKEVVNQRLIVDDGSTDDTVLIAKARGWEMIRNQGSGISDGANTALKHVETPFFCSFEQDLLLSPNWWKVMSKHIAEANVAAASGIRLPHKPAALRAFNQYVIGKYRRILKNPNSYRHANLQEASSYGHTLDNTIYDTKILLELGGFPHLPNFGGGTDILLYRKIRENNLKWLVDYNICSTHLRQGLRDEINHSFRNSQSFPLLDRRYLTPILPSLVLSPFRALKIALKMKEPSVVYVYPITRFAFFRGLSKGYR